jgi:GDP-mannose 6-dehydrogenase
LKKQVSSEEALRLSRKPAVCVVGLGYVGAVSCACLCDLGHRVVGVDIDKAKIELIGSGKSPIHERDLEEILTKGVEDALLTTTDDLVQAVLDTDVTFLSVGTPTAEDGGCDFRYIEAAAQSIGRALAQKDDYHVVVLRCSVPPGSTLDVMVPIIAEFSGKEVGKDFGICFNPEFLREGVAIDDFRNPPKTVVGAIDDRSAQVVADIFAPVDADPIICSIADAEMVKYVDNVWHATKVCFANEVGRLSKSYGVNGQNVMDIFCQDEKLNISSYYLKPGFAYGGSCLPKEVRAVNYLARQRGVELPLIDSLGNSNTMQIEEATRMVLKDGTKKVTVLGLAFKRGTDDLRESPILEVMARLMDAGVEIKAHDNAISSETNIAGQLAYVRHGAPGLATLSESLSDMIVDDIYEALDGAEVVIVTHRDPKYVEALSARINVRVVDLVGLFDSVPGQISYQGIGW